MKKIIALVLSVLVLTVSMVGCGGNSSTGTIDITAFNGGYGTIWLDNIGKAYTQKTGIQVKVKGSVYSADMLAGINSGMETKDILFMNSSVAFQYENSLVQDMSTVYSSTPEGSSKNISEMLASGYAVPFQTEKGFFGLPYSFSIISFIQNTTVMDEVFGVGKWKTPNTTDEMLAQFSSIRSFDDVIDTDTNEPMPYYPALVLSSYWDYIFLTMWGQYESVENQRDYFKGEYISNGNKILADNAQSVDQPGRGKALSAIEQMVTISSGNVHPDTLDMTAQEAQAAFLGFGFGEDPCRIAYMPNGAWFENETLFMNSTDKFEMVRVPVLSAIIDKCESIANDAELSAIITSIDSGDTSLDSIESSAEFVTGEGFEVTRKDYETVYNARMTTASNGADHVAVIPKNAQDPDLAKDFLTFMCSDEAQSIYSKELRGLIMPYGYDIKNDSNINLSTFASSVYNISEKSLKANQISFIYQNYPIVYLGGLNVFAKTTNGGEAIKGIVVGELTAADAISDTLATYKKDWANILKDSNLGQ